MPKVLLVDDEDTFRAPLARRLRLRGIETIEVDNGEDAVRCVRSDLEVDIVILDRQMPGMSGEQTLREMRGFRPALQVIMLTAHGSLGSAMETGRLDAYAYLQKPCDFGELEKVINDARKDRLHVMAREEIPAVARGSVWKWLAGSHNSRPGV
ncbi:MAG: response regulator, partial [Acidobacteriota bacterium]